MTSKTVFIVIPVHNRLHFTRGCLDSLRKQTVRSYQAVVVDDGSSDGTGETIATDYPEVQVLRGDGNLWWTGATNLGVEYALSREADFVLTLNNDTIADESFLENMLCWAEKVPSSLLGAFALDSVTKEPSFGGERIDWKKVSSTFLLDILKPEEQHGLHEVSHFPGRGLMIPAEVFRKIGLFDAQRFPHYAADYDFTFRAARAGYKVFCNYDARLYIYPDASGDMENRRKKTPANYLQHLFGRKGGGNLLVFATYVWRNCPGKYRASFLLKGTVRRVFGYWVRKG